MMLLVCAQSAIVEALQLRKAPKTCPQHRQMHQQEDWDDTDLTKMLQCVHAEMPPNVTVTLKGRRSEQHASLGHLAKVMETMNGLDRPALHASVPTSCEAKPGPAPGPHTHSGARLERHASDVMAAAGPPAQPPPRRQKSAPLRDRPQHDRFLQEQPRPGLTLARFPYQMDCLNDQFISTDVLCAWLAGHAVGLAAASRSGPVPTTVCKMI